jgi:hypothetical protein
MTRAGWIVGIALVSCHPRGGAREGTGDASAPAASAAASVASAAPPAASAAAPAADLALPEPPYDLAADIRRRTEAARVELGARTRTRVEGDVYVFVSPDGGPLFDRTVDFGRDALPAYFHGLFTRPADRAVTAIVFSTREAYHAFCRRRTGHDCDTDYGFYRVGPREIVVNAASGPGTITHEMTHPIVQTDFSQAPAWFDEGIGSLFEMPDVTTTPGEIHGRTNPRRLAHLRHALASPATRGQVTLEALFAMSDDDFRGKGRELWYAIARTLCQWLDDDQRRLWAFYRAWRDGQKTDPTGEKAFRSVVGKTPAEATAEWLEWVSRL